MPQANNHNGIIVPLTSPVGSTATLTGTSSTVIGQNLNRRGIEFINSGSVTVYICPSNQTAAVGEGIMLLPGASASFFGTELLNYNCGWNGISSSGSTPLGVLEFV
jgi:hypothetical protein